MVIFISWIILSVIAGVLGGERKLGGAAAFFISLFLSPLIGFICVLASERKKPAGRPQWETLTESGDLELFKGKKSEAIEKYKEAIFYLLQEDTKFLRHPSVRKKIEQEINKINTKIREIKV